MALARDTNLEVIPLLDEGAPGFRLSAPDVEGGETGFTHGPPLPADNTRRILRFEGISAQEEVHPTVAQTRLRRLLNYFHAGGQLRVYRNYPAVVTAWSTTNPDGYDDIVPSEHGTGAYEWFSGGSMVRHSFVLEGIAIAS